MMRKDSPTNVISHVHCFKPARDQSGLFTSVMISLLCLEPIADVVLLVNEKMMYKS